LASTGARSDCSRNSGNAGDTSAPIRLIGDLAYAALEPHEFLEFLNGRLSRAFVKDQDDLESRLSKSITIADPDGLFRVEDFFCHDDTWRMTVSRLASRADAVLMDLRGFSPTNRGCIFEIEQLIASVSLHRVVLLADTWADIPFLELILRDAWRIMSSDSPNAVAGRHRLRILQASSNHGRTLDTLLGFLCESFGQGALRVLPRAEMSQTCRGNVRSRQEPRQSASA
jgi:hypothetical protein